MRKMMPKKSLDREELLIDAMRRSIAKRGYSATSLSDIISETGGSRRNIYKAFGDKRGLLNAAIERAARDIVETSFDVPDDQAPRDWLIAMGVSTMKAVLNPELVSLFRILIAEQMTDEQTGRQILMAGPERFVDQLMKWLIARNNDGTLQVEAPNVTAPVT
ncbi:MAG: TetR/AcrR family transcriptional regulator [Pseudomonadota bacterium]